MGEPVERRIGEYVLTRPIGQGGMGVVYLARQPHLGRVVAVKVLSAERAKDPTYLGRFHQEAQAAATLHHPNLVAVVDSGEDPGSGDHYLVMEYVAGRDLDAILSEDGPLSERRALEITRDVARALACAAAQGIVHRDVKPGNVLIAADGTAKLTDLGLAKVAGSARSLTAAGVTVGSPWYMAPEQALGRRALDVRADLYSLGLCLWELLSGTVPFVGADELDRISPFEVLRRHAEEDLPSVRTVAPDVSEDAARLLAALAARDPDGRYASAEEALDDLERVLAGQPARGPTRRRAPAEGQASAGAGCAEQATPLNGEGAADGSASTARRELVYAAAGVVGLGLLLGGVAVTARGLGGAPAAKEPPGLPSDVAAPGPSLPASPAGVGHDALTLEDAAGAPVAAGRHGPVPGPISDPPDDSGAAAAQLSAAPTVADVSALLLRDVTAGAVALEAGRRRWQDPAALRVAGLLRRAVEALAPGAAWPTREHALEALKADLLEAGTASAGDPILAREVEAWAAFARGALALVRSLNDPRARSQAVESLDDETLAARGVAEDAQIFLARVDRIDGRVRWARVPSTRDALVRSLTATRKRLERAALGWALGDELLAVDRALTELLEDPEACLTTALAAAGRAAPASIFVGRRLREVPAGASLSEIPGWGLRVELATPLTGAACVEVELIGEASVALSAAAIRVGEQVLPLDWRGARGVVFEPRPWGLLVRVPGAAPEDHPVALRPKPGAARSVFAVRARAGADLARIARVDLPERP